MVRLLCLALSPAAAVGDVVCSSTFSVNGLPPLSGSVSCCCCWGRRLFFNSLCKWSASSGSVSCYCCWGCRLLFNSLTIVLLHASFGRPVSLLLSYCSGKRAGMHLSFSLPPSLSACIFLSHTNTHTHTHTCTRMHAHTHTRTHLFPPPPTHTHTRPTCPHHRQLRV